MLYVDTVDTKAKKEVSMDRNRNRRRLEERVKIRFVESLLDRGILHCDFTISLFEEEEGYIRGTCLVDASPLAKEELVEYRGKKVYPEELYLEFSISNRRILLKEAFLTTEKEIEWQRKILELIPEYFMVPRCVAWRIRPFYDGSELKLEFPNPYLIAKIDDLLVSFSSSHEAAHDKFLRFIGETFPTIADPHITLWSPERIEILGNLRAYLLKEWTKSYFVHIKLSFTIENDNLIPESMELVGVEDEDRKSKSWLWWLATDDTPLVYFLSEENETFTKKTFQKARLTRLSDIMSGLRTKTKKEVKHE